MRLILKNFKKLVVQHTGLFLLLFFSIAFSVFGVLFLSGYSAYSHYNGLEQNRCELTVYLIPGSPKEEVASLAQALSENAFSSYTTLTAFCEELPKTSFTTLEEGERPTFPMVGRQDGSLAKGLLLGRFFEEGENAPALLLSETAAAFLSLADPLAQQVEIDQVSYTVVGILWNTLDTVYYVPLTYYLAEKTTNLFKATYGAPIARSEVEALIGQYEQVVSSYVWEDHSSLFGDTDFLMAFMQVLLLFLFVFLNIIVLLLFWQRLYRRQYAVYRLCGIGRKQAFCCVFGQIGMMALLGTLFGTALYIFFLPLFERLEIVRETLSDCLIIGSTVFLLILLFAIPISLHAARIMCRSDGRGRTHGS